MFLARKGMKYGDIFFKEKQSKFVLKVKLYFRMRKRKRKDKMV